MRTHRSSRALPWVLALALLAVGCSGSAQLGAEPTPRATVNEQPAAAEGLITSVDDVELATVQIVSEGAFQDPEFGQRQVSGSGSGFIIDPSGIAVTNNHVVTGGALYNVYVGGEDEPRNARVLGVSECSDLAVIDIDGEAFPYLRWYDGEVDERLEVFAAGFPLGEREFTLTDGIVNTAQRRTETPWASVERVLEHSARIRDGNSGGPLVTADGAVVGINYAGSDETDQNLAINASEARPLVEQLRAGERVTSIGVNGMAVNDGAGNTGIWVASVESGSPAAETGIRGGDIITRIESVTLAEDGTVADYCDILRSHDNDDVLSIEVLRYDTGEVFEGQLNGGPLQPVTSFEQELGDPSTSSGAAADYAEYVTIRDDTGSIEVSVPSEWSEVDGRPATDDQGRRYADVRAASNLQGFTQGWETPGVIVSASSQVPSELELLDPLVGPLSGSCTYSGRHPYSDALYTGQYDLYTDCGGVGATYVVVGARPADGTFSVRVQVQANSDRDFQALDRILDSFVITGAV